MNSLYVWTIFAIVVQEGEAAFRSQAFELLIEYKDKYVTAGSLWITDVDTIYSCAVFCQNDIQCKSFFYGENTCSGYHLNEPKSSDITTQNGLEFYRKIVTCDGGYTYDSNMCHKIKNVNTTWDQARQLCSDEGAHLAIIDRPEKLDVIRNIPSSMCSDVFVPYYNKCYFLTTNADTWSNSVLNCLAAGGTPATFPDAATYLYVINATGINGSSADVWIGVGDFNTEGQWENYDGSNLQLLDFMFDWVNEGSENGKDWLAIIPTENNIWRERSITDNFKMLCESNIEISFWVGGSDITSEGTWIWEDGKPVNMTYFLSGQPAGSNTKNCAALSSTNNGFLLSENVCTLSKKFICEKP